MSNIEETVVTAIREIRGTHVPEKLTRETNLKEMADSLDIIEIIMEVEEKLDADVSDADLEDLKTVGDLVTLFEGAK